MTTTPLFLGRVSSSHSDFATVRIVMRTLRDLLLILVATGLVLSARLTGARAFLIEFNSFREARDREMGAICLVLFMGCYLWTAYRCGLYSLKTLHGISDELRLVLQSCATAGLALCGSLYLCRGIGISRGSILWLVASSSLALCLQRCAESMLRSRTDSKRSARTIAIVGTNQFSFVLSEHLRNKPQLLYSFLGFLKFPGSKQSSEITACSILGEFSDIDHLKEKYFIDEILVAEYCPAESIIELIDRASVLGIDVRAVSGYYPHLTVNAPVEYLGDFPVSSLHRTKSRAIALVLKRAVDVVVSCAALLLAAIPVVLVAIAIKLGSKGPVFYISERLGKRGRSFRCFKFRTMVAEAEMLKKDLMGANERDGALFKMRDDPRVTRIGRFLRKYSIDEIPQLMNVVLGDMSLVGPRPPIPSEVAQYNLEQLHRLSVLPGITGLWQVKARMDNSFARYIALDISYVENWSPWLDTKILFRTLDVVLRGTGS